mgnify:CR=1 FL=1
MAKPIVKWAGGKSRLVPQLLARVPPEVGTYVEPFAGGAALFFALQASVSLGTRRVNRFVLCDRNEELMATYRAVQREVEAVIAALGAYRYDRDLFYEVRARDTRGASDVERAARLLFLNRTCFNGLWRVNADGRFNVPFGRYKNPRFLQPDAPPAASAPTSRGASRGSSVGWVARVPSRCCPTPTPRRPGRSFAPSPASDCMHRGPSTPTPASGATPRSSS